LELGVDLTGIDAVLLVGYPGTRAATWQQVGRAGRAGQDALGVLVARADPLDAYLVHHPDSLLAAPVEATVLDPDNPYVLAGQLAAAAAELPLTPSDLPLFGPTAGPVIDQLVTARALRARPAGWYWSGQGRASELADLRGSQGSPVQVVEQGTGRLLGTVDAAAAPASIHPGAIYLHQGAHHLVDELDLATGVALVHPVRTDWTTTAHSVSQVSVVAPQRSRQWGEVVVSFGVVDVTSQVVSYQRRHLLTGRVLDERRLDLPARTLRTAAVWWTVPDRVLAAAGLNPADVPGAAHAAEHAAIGLLPLVATCDRWDVGGLSTACHPDTGMMTIFVHDAYPGGAGFAERGYDAAAQWLTASRAAIADCPCTDGCPSCIHSPKCGNGNNPLNKRGALRLLDVTLSGATPLSADRAFAAIDG
jgi:DEAD/DEAH box helicase domain-containing protein